MIPIVTAKNLLHRACLLIALQLLFCGSLWGEEQKEEIFLTPEQLKEYQFEKQPEQVEIEITDLSVGQRFIMASQRRNVLDLIYRQLGIVKLHGGLDDLKVLQRIVDKQLFRRDDMEGWQAVGVVFGDTLAQGLDLHWVQMEDEFGTSKALQWKKTNNFVFPITMLSKRQKWGQAIDLQALYTKIESDVSQFREPLGKLGK